MIITKEGYKIVYIYQIMKWSRPFKSLNYKIKSFQYVELLLQVSHTPTNAVLPAYETHLILREYFWGIAVGILSLDKVLVNIKKGGSFIPSVQYDETTV